MEVMSCSDKVRHIQPSLVIGKQMQEIQKENGTLTIRIEASALADGIPVLNILPPAASKGVRPVLPNKERKTS